MAARFDAATDQLSATTSLTDGFSITFWGKISVDLNAFSTFYNLGQAAFTNFSLIQTGTDGVTARITAQGGNDNPMQAMTVGSWYRFGVTKSGTTLNAYMGPATGALTTYGPYTTAITPAYGFLVFGASDTAGSEFLNGCIASIKVWNSVAISAAEVESELQRYVPIRPTTRSYPMIGAEVTDYSGNGLNLTAGSTATATEDGPPIPWTTAAGPQSPMPLRRAANF